VIDTQWLELSGTYQFPVCANDVNLLDACTGVGLEVNVEKTMS